MLRLVSSAGITPGAVGSPLPTARNSSIAVVSPQQLEFDISDATDPVSEINVWPQDMKKTLASITIGSLFSRWYVDELHKCSPESHEDRQKFNMCAKLVQFAKYFLPGGAVIEPKPSKAADFISWSANLLDWGKMLDVDVHAFAEKGTLELKSGAQKRKRSSLPVVSATYKRLTKLDGNAELVKTSIATLRPQIPSVVDNASALVIS